MTLYNPKDPMIHVNPYPCYHAIRESERLHWNNILNSWMVFGYEDVKTLFKDPRLSSRRSEVVINKAPKSVRNKITAFAETAERLLLFLDAPEHTRKRKLTGKALADRFFKELQPNVQEVVAECLETATAKESFDMVQDVASPVSLMVICDMLGIPRGDHKMLHEVTDTVSMLVANPKPTVEMALTGDKMVRELYDYFRTKIAKRRENPGTDLLSRLILAEEDGDLLDEMDILVNCSMVLFAGYEAVANVIGTGFLNLLKHPDQIELLVNDPSLVPAAVDEMLRYESPVQLVTRLAIEDIEMDGKVIKAGQPVYLGVGGANRDPNIFENPNRFDIQREKPERHLSFGHGSHLCLGAPLARYELVSLFTKALELLPGMRLTDKELNWRKDIANRGLTSLEIQLIQA